MPSTLSPTDVCNIALQRIGAQSIGSLTDLTNQSAISCNTAFLLAYLKVSRSGVWNCLLDTAVLVEEPQTPVPGSTPPSPAPDWAPNTFYVAETFLNYGAPPYVYQVMFDYTSTNNFFNDLTTGALVQTNVPINGDPFFSGSGTQYPSGWAFKFALPDDFQLLAALNDNVYWSWNGGGSTSTDYEIMGTSLFCDWSQAIVQYVKNEPDCTRWDVLFTDAVTFKVAEMIATPLRQDGGRLEAAMLQGYKDALKEARTKNAGERQERRFNPINSSRFLAARYYGINN